MAKNPYKETVKQLFDLRKKAMSKNATEQDVLRYTYFSMEVVKDNLQEENFTALLGAVYGAKFKGVEAIQQVAYRLMQSRVAPALFYNEDVSSTSPNLTTEVRNRADVINCVENSNWKKYMEPYFNGKNLPDGKIEDYTKALMLMEQIGLEGSITSRTQKYAESKLKKSASKSTLKKIQSKAGAKSFLSRNYEVDSAMTKAKIAVLGGQEKYDELMKILNGEVPFDSNANKLIQEAINSCNEFGKIVQALTMSSNIKYKGDYNTLIQLQDIEKGHKVPIKGEEENLTMGVCLSQLNDMLQSQMNDMYYIQLQNGIVNIGPTKTIITEMRTDASAEEIREEHVDTHIRTSGGVESGDEGM